MNAEQACPHAENAVGLALHALEPADEDVLTEHVPHCQVCQELVRQTQDVVWGLAAAAQRQDPPARLRSTLMSTVAATPQLPPEQREQPWVAPDPSVPVPATRSGGDRRPGRQPAANGNPPRPAGANRTAGWARRRRLIALATTVAVAVVGAGGLAVELVARARQQDQSVLAQPSPQVNRILVDLDRAGVRHAVLHAPNGEVLAAVAQFPDQRQVVPIGLKANTTDNTVYVLWGLGAGPPAAVGTFDVSGPSESMVPVGAATRPAQYGGYAISIENGRTAPPSPTLVVASGQVAS